MKLQQTQKLNQILSLTPQMRQSLQVLQLPLIELKDYLQEQIEENPVLDLESEDFFDQYPQSPSTTEIIDMLMEYDKDSQETPLEYSSEEIRKKHDYKESLISQPPTLEEHLLKQLKMLSLDEEAYKIGEFIIINLDDNGYLNLTLEEIISSINKEKPAEKRVTKQKVEKVLSAIHNFDPPGIGARNLKECLLIQLKLKKKENPLSYEIINSYLPEVVKNKNSLIAKKLKVDLTQVNEAIREISSLEPKPGRAAASSVIQETAPSLPDVVIENVNNKYEIIVNTRWVPKLKINPYYLNLLKSGSISPQTKKYIQEKIRRAAELVKAISQREETIKKIAHCIVKIQKDFFEQGDSSLLKPLAYRDVAKIVNRNESTISRTVKNKYISTPYGIFKLDYFFTKSLKNRDGERISQEFVKNQILNIISEEDKKNTLKDSEIAKILQSQEIRIARRTVAKYREELKLPSYYLRRRLTQPHLRRASDLSESVPWLNNSQQQGQP